MQKPVDVARETCQELLTLLEVEATVNAEEQIQDEQKTILLNIDTEKETGLLIGAHGATLNAIQVFLGMALRQHFDEWVRVVVNIGDWKEKQDEQLFSLASQAATRAKATGEAQRLYNLSPSQRRSIHLHLSTDEKIVTESEGEGEERYLVVKRKG